MHKKNTREIQILLIDKLRHRNNNGREIKDVDTFDTNYFERSFFVCSFCVFLPCVSFDVVREMLSLPSTFRIIKTEL